MGNRIKVKNTSIEIHNYELHECQQLEDIFKVWNCITHRFDYIGMHYDEDKKILYLPAGMNIWQIKNFFGEKYYDRISEHPYRLIKDIKMKFPPRDEEQVTALKFTCGLEEFADNAYLPELFLNLVTGKGKTYVSIATIAFFKIKSIIITGSNSLLSQWKDEILKYTTLKEDEVIQISGSNTINMIFSGKSNKFNNASIYLCTHGTLRSYGDNYGWDKIYKLFEYLGIGLKFYDEAHTNFENMLMVDYNTNVYKTYFVSATAMRSSYSENRIFQISIRNIPILDLFDENKDPHTAYVAIKYNSRPTPQQISMCKNKYGLDRMKYIDYITKNPNFYLMMRIIMDLVIKCKGRVLMYIGTNEGILRLYHWIGHNYPEFIGEIGVFTSLVSPEMKLEEKKKKLLLSTTKSAGLGEHIEGLKMTIVLAEPFKSPVLARQTLGRTRDDNTTYIELVDVGFKYTNQYYLSKQETFNKYASSVSDTFIDKYELTKRAENIISKRKTRGVSPIVISDQRFNFSEEALSNTDIDTIDKAQLEEHEKFSIGDNPYLR